MEGKKTGGPEGPQVGSQCVPSRGGGVDIGAL